MSSKRRRGFRVWPVIERQRGDRIRCLDMRDRAEKPAAGHPDARRAMRADRGRLAREHRPPVPAGRCACTPAVTAPRPRNISRAAASLRSWRSKYAMVRRSPSSSDTSGCQPSVAFATSILGQRWTGSSTGSGLRTIFERDPTSSITFSASSPIVNSTGLPRLIGPVTSSGAPSAARSRRSGRRRSRTSGSACRRRRW